MQDVRQGYCLPPSWTFVGCAHAVNLSGLTPFLCEVSRKTGTMTTKDATAALTECSNSVPALMPVNLFGEPVSVEELETLKRETGVKVVLECAGGFDTFHPSSSLEISLHVARLFSAGEGSLLITRDNELAERVRRATNFGFSLHRAF
ncbi:MAG: DegT/DnrJ/EryC1/StrS family aminotransferase [Pseudomonadota bacterium]|nr:DegT/DnrJ/EryC1/StrS family aminotransferase [Pseudomonadota bacterium]